MTTLPIVDITVFFLYLAGVVLFGCWFVNISRSSEKFTVAGRSLPGWAVGVSIFGTYLSSNTFIGVPGRAYGTNWNFFVFTLTLPVAAWLATRFFVPFYRRSREISAYHHLEGRFGPWARTYAVVCYLFTQIARMAAIMFGVALALNALTGWSMVAIILTAGALVTLYTLLGGIEAVIWTDVVQSIILVGGAVLVAAFVTFGMPGGPASAVSIAHAQGKFSLGSFGMSLTESTFWVVFLYGVCINLNNFGIDQSYVQRYHTSRSERDARRSVWIGALTYIPVSLLFFFIGASLFSYYDSRPDMLDEVRTHTATVAVDNAPGMLSGEARDAAIRDMAAGYGPTDIGDKVLPHFIVTALPIGLAGLLIAAIAAAAMSSIDTGLNSSATVILSDIYIRYIRPGAHEAERMRVLHGATLIWGILGTAAALAMIGVESILAVWWELSGIFAGALLGLFLLGMIWRAVDGFSAVIAVTAGVTVILWMTVSPRIEVLPSQLQSPFHPNLTIVAGTLSIILVGLATTLLRGGSARKIAPMKSKKGHH
jgi:solute:Na+ symporter, SSS family